MFAIPPHSFRKTNSKKNMNPKLKELKEMRAENSITIILNTHRTLPDNQKDAILLKNLVKEAERRLLDDFPKREVEGLITKLNALADKINHRENLESLVLFVNQHVAIFIRLPIPVVDRVVIDNTFATPYLQQPFKHGVDFVFHSTTKFLNGHGTAIGGVLLGKDLEKMNGHVKKTYRILGVNSNPFDAFLLNLGMKTLELRMDRHCFNALKVAEFLDTHSAISKVNYAGLASHPDHKVAMKQMKHGGGMLSFEMKNGLKASIDFMNKLKMCVRTVSLGTAESISARIEAASSVLGLSSVTTALSAMRPAISPIMGRLPLSRSPPAPNRTWSLLLA